MLPTRKLTIWVYAAAAACDLALVALIVIGCQYVMSRGERPTAIETEELPAPPAIPPLEPRPSPQETPTPEQVLPAPGDDTKDTDAPPWHVPETNGDGKTVSV